MVMGAVVALFLDGAWDGRPVAASTGTPLDPNLAFSVFSGTARLDLPDLRPEDARMPNAAIERTIKTVRIARPVIDPPRTSYPSGLVPNPDRYTGAPIPPLAWPTDGEITSPFGYRVLRGRFRHHAGLDVRAPHGTPVRASAPGLVVFAGWWGGYGRLVVLDHGEGIRTWYAHNRAIRVAAGQRVDTTTVIATAGATGHAFGPHTHFELRLGGVPVDPIRHMASRDARPEDVTVASAALAPGETLPASSADVPAPAEEGIGGP